MPITAKPTPTEPHRVSTRLLDGDHTVSQQSSGLLLCRHGANGILEFLIGHMGGPFWAKKHDHAWSIPKGLAVPNEVDSLAVAEREFAEEMGSPPPLGPTIELGTRRRSGKAITIFARLGDFDATSIVSNTFEMEWPPRSGRIVSFPEIDRAAWVGSEEARRLLTKGQVEFIDLALVAFS